MNLAPAPARSVSLSALLQGEVDLPAAYERQLSGIQLDSRRVRPGDLFIACKGASSDGRSFISGAIASGAAAVLVEADAEWHTPSAREEVPLVPVSDLSGKVHRVAARFFGEPAARLRLIGITGTNGKTSCCQLIARCLTTLGYRCGVIGTLGHGMADGRLVMDDRGPSTTPDAVQLQRIFADIEAQRGDAVVMEVSSHGLAQKRVNVDDFDAAVFTNLTHDHLDYHGTMEAYGEAKRTLFTGTRLRAAVLNMDDPFSARILATLPATALAFTWSLRDTSASVHAREVRFAADGLRMHVVTPWGKGLLQSRLFGSFNASNMLGVLATVLAVEAARPGFDPVRILAAVSALEPVQGRMELIGGYPVGVIVDYAHTPDGLEKALHALREHFSGSITCVFGCGGDRDAGKRPAMAAIAERLADTVIVTDDNPRTEGSAKIIADIMAGFSAANAVRVQANRARAIAEAIDAAEPGSVVLIAGKGHEAYQEVQGRRSHFSDVEEARRCLEQRFGKQ